MINIDINKILDRIDILTIMGCLLISAVSFIITNDYAKSLCSFTLTYFIITFFTYYVRNRKHTKLLLKEEQRKKDAKEQQTLKIEAILLRMFDANNKDSEVIEWLLNQQRDSYYENVFIVECNQEAYNYWHKVERLIAEYRLYETINRYKNRNFINMQIEGVDTQSMVIYIEDTVLNCLKEMMPQKFMKS
ncbi:hypothetical protein [Francisella philomiragia]|uniref:Uncharacterized protein n=1 Tax=Francisella philomiragia TaxID=28110 RepID=A0A0B6D514_9GAMM|nr:hypothetical protein [Francisella philomiragia]AJI53936.1 hypothetical protein LA55_923 [Francisella philomiragia]